MLAKSHREEYEETSTVLECQCRSLCVDVGYKALDHSIGRILEGDGDGDSNKA